MRLLIATFLVFASLQTVWAVPVTGLYNARIEVANQTESERLNAFKSGLVQVLVKVSGMQSVANQSVIENALMKSSEYVQRFSYDVETELPKTDVALDTVVSDAMGNTLTETPLEESLDKEIEEEKELAEPIIHYWLNLEYSATAVNQLLVKSALPVWGYNRPGVVFWVAIETDGNREMISGDSSQRFATQLKANAIARGLPVYLPVYDLQDSQVASISDVWGLFLDPVRKASARYRADSVVVVRLYKTLDGLWQANWVHDLKGEQVQVSLDSADINDLALQLVTQVTDRVAQRYSVLAVNEALANSVEIEVEDVNTFEDYVHLTRYLQSLAPVSQVQVSMVKAQTLRLTVQLKGTMEQFEEHLELDRRLTPALAPVEQIDEGFRNYYHWSEGQSLQTQG